MGLWYQDNEYHATDRVQVGKVRKIQEDDADVMLEFIRRNAPLAASLEEANWEGFTKEEIEKGTQISRSRFQRSMRTLVSKNAVTRLGNTRNTRYKLT